MWKQKPNVAFGFLFPPTSASNSCPTPRYLRPETGAPRRPAVRTGYPFLEHNEVQDEVVQQYGVFFVIAS